MRKNYKEKYCKKGMDNKRGQVAIYIIVALVIVGIILVLYLFPSVRTTISGAEFSPNSYLKSCVEADVKTAVTELAQNGGYSKPEGTILYQGKQIKYLCYSSDNYKTCTVQQPMIKSNFEKELSAIVTPKANDCVKQLKAEYESRGYSVSAASANSQVSIIPGSVRIDFIAPMSITKDSTETYNGFDVEVDSEMYDLLMTAQSVIEFESTYGDSETTLYLQYYPDLKMEKVVLSDGSTIYKLSNVNTKEEFVFASRSLVWPPGYGL